PRQHGRRGEEQQQRRAGHRGQRPHRAHPVAGPVREDPQQQPPQRPGELGGGHHRARGGRTPAVLLHQVDQGVGQQRDLRDAQQHAHPVHPPQCPSPVRGAPAGGGRVPGGPPVRSGGGGRRRGQQQHQRYGGGRRDG